MRQCATNEAVRPCLIRMKANGVKKKKVNNRDHGQSGSSLHQFGGPGNGGAVPASAAKRCGSRNGDDPSFSRIPQAEGEQGEWWLQVKLEHPYEAIELIESYKRITGFSLGKVNYNLQLLESDVRHGPSIA